MRCHINPAAAAATAPPLVADLPQRLAGALSDVKAAVVAAAPTLSGGPTLYTGLAGVAYALARAARADPSLLPLAAQQAASAAAADRKARRVPGSVMDGRAGVAVVQALVSR